MKTCSKCGLEKEENLFHKRNGRPNGRQSSCIECKKKYRSENKDREGEKRRAYYLKNRDKILEDSAKWLLENKERKAATNREWYQENRERVQAYSKENKEKIKHRYAIWYEKYKPIKFAKVAEWRRLNIQRVYASNRTRRAKIKGSSGSHEAGDINLIMNMQRGKCAYSWCKKTLKLGYHVDHIMPLFLGGPNGRENLQLLCPECNLKKSKKHPIDFAQENGLLL